MSYKKMLVIILVVILTMFGLMLTTSYAWYSFEAASTTFSAVTNNDDIEVTFMKGEYINNTVAVPIKEEDVDQYSDKHPFAVRVKNNKEDNEILVSVSLVDIVMDTELNVSQFKVELYHQGTLIKSLTGANISTNTEVELADVILDEDIDNNLEVRVYLLDDDTDQSALMNKSFQAKMEVNVVSRLKTSITDWESPDIYISSITIDGVSSNYLPTDGLYTMSATCSKGSTLTWDAYTKTITYAEGSYVNDSCSLTFTSSTDYMYLNEVDPGSYVQYIGTNGCDGKSCEGQNANYVSDNNMGYCSDNKYKFFVNGWRVGYIKDNTAYLISAGAPECMNLYIENTEYTSTTTLNNDYYYASGYTFDKDTGIYTLTGITSTTLAWSSNYQSIISNTPYSCLDTTTSDSCEVMYKITDYLDDGKASVTYYRNYDTQGLPNLFALLNKRALTYCNHEYAYEGVCDESTSWVLNGLDLENLLGNGSTITSCLTVSSDKKCGYTNDLIDNGGYYWYATARGSASNNSYFWSPYYRYISHSSSIYMLGIRPILRLDENVVVVGGTGTYEDPYQIKNV